MAEKELSRLRKAGDLEALARLQERLGFSRREEEEARAALVAAARSRTRALRARLARVAEENDAAVSRVAAALAVAGPEVAQEVAAREAPAWAARSQAWRRCQVFRGAWPVEDPLLPGVQEFPELELLDRAQHRPEAALVLAEEGWRQAHSDEEAAAWGSEWIPTTPLRHAPELARREGWW